MSRRTAIVLLALVTLPPAPATAQLSLRARVTTAWGTGEATRCVPDVADAFARMPRRSTPLGFHLGSQPPLSRLGKHWQGVARLAVGDGRWLVASRSGADSAIAVVHMGSRATLPVPWGSNRLRGGLPDPTVPAPRGPPGGGWPGGRPVRVARRLGARGLL